VSGHISRTCGDCSLCCKLLAIETIGKTRGQWCRHCNVGSGCSQYSARPDECREFHCGFLTIAALDESWRPSRSKLVLGIEAGGQTVFVHVDPDRPQAWRKEPYYSRLKEWSRAAAASRGQVIVRIGKRAIVVFPDRDAEVGLVEDDECVATSEVRGADGIRLDAIVMKLDDPRLKTQLSQSSRRAIPLA